jgi:prepilin-type N-terminal cleavage/methylation domain-containing protein
MRASGRDIREAVAGRLSPRALQAERGFTLIEVVIVMVVLAVLAAIALTQFLDTTEKAKDADAKSNVGGLATLVETCFVEEEDYGRCDTNAELEGAPGLSYGTGPGEVYVSRAEERTFEVTAV